MPVIRINANLDRRNDRSNFLLAHRRNVYSQAGEDGVIAEIFNLIGTQNKWCVEFGAWDGVNLSNTCRLIREDGWSAVLIEGEAERCGEIRSNHPDAERVHVANEWVGFAKGENSIDEILARTPIPKDFDFICIDVDGVDWHIWDSIADYRPRVVCIEINNTVPNNVVFIQDRDMGINEGCSLAAVIELGKAKGYELVSVVGANAIFVVEEAFPDLGIADNSIEAMRSDVGSYLWNGYNGKIYNSARRLGWWVSKMPFAPDSLQLVNEFRFHGVVQGRADDCFFRAARDEEDLETADGIVRELHFVRSNRKTLDEDEFKRRNTRVWAAAKIWSERKRGWSDGDEDGDDSDDE